MHCNANNIPMATMVMQTCHHVICMSHILFNFTIPYNTHKLMGYMPHMLLRMARNCHILHMSME
jgi:hypothetical protein